MLLGQYARLNTSFPTVGTADRESVAYHVQAGYWIPGIPIPLLVAYRYAHYDPWSSRDADAAGDLASLGLDYHTLGLQVRYPDDSIDLRAFVDYTITTEETGRALDNNRLQVAAQLAF